jgi:uncharacterized protein YndB with AHSA1/START domain
MTQTPMGTVHQDGEVVVLSYRRDLRHPPEKVWRAITESTHLRHWFPADIVGERVAGAELRFVFWPEAVAHAGEEIEAVGVTLDDPALPGRMVTWEPPRLLELLWDTEHLRFDLEPVDAGTVLRVTVRAPEPGPRGYESTAAGYHICLDALVDHLDGTPTSIFDEQRSAALEQEYAATLGREDALGAPLP